MKLRNKKTGEILELCSNPNIEDLSTALGKRYSSLADLTAEWEDYEKPKEYWTIGRNEEAGGFYVKRVYGSASTPIARKEDGKFGIKFETEKEAERAVEKLRAWKRLRVQGFKFNDWYHDDGGWHPDYRSIRIDANITGDINEQDLNLLFGDEEC